MSDDSAHKHTEQRTHNKCVYAYVMYNNKYQTVNTYIRVLLSSCRIVNQCFVTVVASGRRHFTVLTLGELVAWPHT